MFSSCWRCCERAGLDEEAETGTAVGGWGGVKGSHSWDGGKIAKLLYYPKIDLGSMLSYQEQRQLEARSR